MQAKQQVRAASMWFMSSKAKNAAAAYAEMRGTSVFEHGRLLGEKCVSIELSVRPRWRLSGHLSDQVNDVTQDSLMLRGTGSSYSKAYDSLLEAVAAYENLASIDELHAWLSALS